MDAHVSNIRCSPGAMNDDLGSSHEREAGGMSTESSFGHSSSSI